MNKKNIAITTIPFEDKNLEFLKKSGFDLTINPFGRRIKNEEVFNFVKYAEGIIAGTEQYDSNLLSSLSNLKAISRVGIGVDNIDLEYAEQRGIKIFNTPDQPADAVAEYCLGMTICLLRDAFFSHDRLSHNKNWNRELGLSLSEVTIGLIGAGRVAKKFKDLLLNCGVKEIKVFDIVDLSQDPEWKSDHIKIVDIELLKSCDVISLHLPLNEQTYHLIDRDFLDSLTNKSFIINTSRGEIVDEVALVEAINKDKIRGAVVDVFNNEPYDGILLGNNKIITTPHIASSSKIVRSLMEHESCTNLIQYLNEK